MVKKILLFEIILLAILFAYIQNNAYYGENEFKKFIYKYDSNAEYEIRAISLNEEKRNIVMMFTIDGKTNEEIICTMTYDSKWKERYKITKVEYLKDDNIVMTRFLSAKISLKKLFTNVLKVNFILYIFMVYWKYRRRKVAI